MDEVTKRDALEKAKKMFDKFDIDNDNHSAIIIMYDGQDSQFRMLMINTNPGQAMLLLDNAVESVIEDVSDAVKYRTMN